ncbi:unnamed protein product [Pleuronectes platessa]|uniref:Uncharacterized protein n=1 Tax=Pleuronectes platessa TaxID=8262 RepID=A0A9N7VEC3_PLEPL|nr:unnamed protein product [Pleuronectes platessa]
MVQNPKSLGPLNSVCVVLMAGGGPGWLEDEVIYMGTKQRQRGNTEGAYRPRGTVCVECAAAERTGMRGVFEKGPGDSFPFCALAAPENSSAVGADEDPSGHGRTTFE